MEKTFFRTLHQVSAGGIIYRLAPNSTVEVVVAIRQGGEIWCLPKGVVETGEILEVTAVRGVQEETGLLGKLQGKIGK